MAQIDRDTKIRLAAYLRGVQGLTEQQIAPRLGIVQSTVSELLSDARAEGLYEESFTYHGGALSVADHELLYTLQFQSDLQKQIIAALATRRSDQTPRLYLYDLRAAGGRDGPIESRVRSFAACAAPELRRLLSRPSVKTIGVAWGGTIAITVAEMGKAKPPLRNAKSVNVVAMCGEPLEDRTTMESSSAIAENLSDVLTGSRKYARTLGITPAYLPSKSHYEGAEWIWDYIVATKPYVEVFGTDRLPPRTRARITTPADPLCNQLDAFLTSVSIEGGTLGYGKNKLYPTDIINSEELENVVFGDMGGIPLPRPNLTDGHRHVLERVNESWTGVTRAHLKVCVEKGFAGRQPASRTPGCILVAVGAGKARTVFQAVVEERMVNHVFLDFECAEALSHLF